MPWWAWLCVGLVAGATLGILAIALAQAAAQGEHSAAVQARREADHGDP